MMKDPWRFLTVSAGDYIGAWRGWRHADPGIEIYRDFDLWMAQAGHGTVFVDGRPIDFEPGMVVLASCFARQTSTSAKYPTRNPKGGSHQASPKKSDR